MLSLQMNLKIGGSVCLRASRMTLVRQVEYAIADSTGQVEGRRGRAVCFLVRSGGGWLTPFCLKIQERAL